MSHSITPSAASKWRLPILIVDDEESCIKGYQRMLQSRGISNAIPCQDSREAMPLMEKTEIGAVLLDLLMPHLTGQELLRYCSQSFPEVPVIVITGLNEVSTAVQCMKDGAFDYIVKPVQTSDVVSAVERALELRELRSEYASFKRRVMLGQLDHPEVFADIISQNARMRSIFQYAESIAPSAKPVLITGETGVGKELMAKALHRLSGRKGPLVTVNAAGLDDNVFSDTLFGHTKGAFTGADRARSGLIAQAARGSLFLDEIGDLSATSQVKLLRLLQDREYFPLGADLPKRADARIIVATNQDLHALQERGAFRKDLYFRLRTHHILLPPLRERLDDLPALLSHFLEKAAKALGKKKPTLPPQLASLLATYPFPGNIRELESIVFDASSVHQAKVLSMAYFKSYIDAHKAQSTATPFQPGVSERGALFALFDELPTLKECQKLAIDEALRRAKGNQSLAARLLGMTPSGLSKALKRG